MVGGSGWEGVVSAALKRDDLSGKKFWHVWWQGTRERLHE